MVKRKKELDRKLAAQTHIEGNHNADVQDNNEDTKSVALTSLEVNGMPSMEELLKSLSYQGMNIALGNAKSDGEYKGVLNGIGTFNQGSGRSKPGASSCATESYI